MREAGREYVRAADGLPNDVTAQIKATMYLLLSGQFEEARVRAQKAVKLDPKSPDAQIALGSALAGLKDFDGALKELEEATVLDPTSAAAFAGVGNVQLARGSRADAEAAFRRAVEAAPKIRWRTLRSRTSCGRQAGLTPPSSRSRSQWV